MVQFGRVDAPPPAFVQPDNLLVATAESVTRQDDRSQIIERYFFVKVTQRSQFVISESVTALASTWRRPITPTAPHGHYHSKYRVRSTDRQAARRLRITNDALKPVAISIGIRRSVILSGVFMEQA